MYKQVYRLETITNLHVGDMGSSFGVVDNTVQKDPVTGLACVYATSLKGALRKAAEEKGLDNVDAIFGSPVREADKKKGGYRFHDARLLFYPVRSNRRAYYMATCPTLLRDASALMKAVGLSEPAEHIDVMLKSMAQNRLYVNAQIQGNACAYVEDWKTELAGLNDAQRSAMARWLPGETGVLMLSDERMTQIAGDGLPVIARNQLENGISNNLWYEELVPRHTVFYTLLLGEREDPAFTALLKDDLIQIGANATVGYGLCKFRAMGGEAHE